MEKRGIILSVGIFLILLVASVNADVGSSNYNITNPTVSDGGGNMSSANYHSDVLFEDISGNVTSNSYNNYFGFWWGGSGIADTTPPNLTINYPANTTYSVSSINFNVTALDDTDISSCWYTLNSGVTNYTMHNLTASDYNHTNSSLVQGSITANFYCNDTSDNVNDSESVVFVVDTINPDISIISPSNNTNSSNTGLNVNYSVSDTNLESCWYSNDSYTTNTTFTDCETNITDVIWTEGQHNVTVWANDSAGNENNSRVSFTIDSTPPDLTIITPSNHTNTTDTSLDVNYTTTDSGLGLDTCWYSNDTYSSNTTLTNCGTNITTVSWTEGNHNVTIWVNDSLNNINSSMVSFTIDSTPPDLTIITPSNNSKSSNTNLNVNYTTSDATIGLDTCWYSNDTMTDNTTLTNCGTNITTVTWIEGQHNVTVWVNDSVDNINSSMVSFTIDTTYPQLNITSPINNSNSTDTGLDVKYTFTELHPDTCWYSNDTMTENTTITCGNNITDVTWIEGEHFVKIWINDSANNINGSSINFTIDSTPPTFDELPTDISLSYPNDFDVDINASDETAFDNYAINTTEFFEINQSGWLNNSETLSVGNYFINITINDSLNNINSTIFNINITQNTTYVLNLTGANPITYGTAGTVNGTLCPTELSCTLVRNDTGEVSNPDTSVLPRGYYNYTYNTTGNANYSASSESMILNVSYSLDECDVGFNETSPLTWNDKFKAYTNCSSEFVLYRNGTIISNNSQQDLSAGSYNFTVIRNDSYNYSLVSDEENFDIAQATSVLNGTINGTQGNFTAVNGSDILNTYINVSVISPCVGDGDLFINGTEYHNGTLPIFNQTNLSIGLYNVTFTYYGNTNCSSGTEVWWVNVTFVDTTLPTFDEEPTNQTITYNTELNYDLNASDETAFDCFAVNDTDFAINCSGDLINNTHLDVALYNINVTINDSSNNLDSRVFWVNVTPISSAINLTLNETQANQSIENGATIDLNCSTITGDSSAILNLYNNGSLINSGTSPIGNSTTFSADDNYNITCIYSNSQNYSASSETWWVNVTTADSTAPNLTINYPGNDSYSVSLINFNVTALDDILMDSCWYSLNDGGKNYTMLNTTATADYNHTNTSIGDGGYLMNVWCNDSSNNINDSESVSFAVDTTDPVVTLRSPTDGSSYSSNSLSSTLAYNVSDTNNVTNCSLIINGVVDSTSFAVNNTNVQLTFSKTFTPGTYNWNVNCSDEVGNIGNSSVWSLTVTAPVTTPPSDGGGGGGGGRGSGGASGILVPDLIVNPDEIKISSVVNTIKTRKIEVYNDGNSDKSIRISVGDLEIIDISEEELNFKLVPGEKRKVEVRLIAPREPGVYTGKIVVSGKTVLVSLDVSSKELLFDVSIVVPDKFKTLNIGKKLESQITLIPIGEEPRLDITLNYEIKDFEGQTFLVESETMLVEGQKSFKKEFATQNLPVGDYVLGLEVVYPNGVAVSSSHFEVRERGIDYKFILIMIGSIIILVIILFIILFRKSYKNLKNLNKVRKKRKNEV